MLASVSPQLRLTLGAVLSLMLSGIIAASAGAAIPLWRAEFGGDLQISWYFNLLFVGGLLGTFVGSRIRLRQPWLPLFIALEGLGLLIVALSPGFSGLLLGALLMGFGVMVGNVHGNSLTLELHRGNVAMLSRVNAAFGLGAVLAPLLIVTMPWRWAYVLFALLALAAAALLWQAPKVQESERSRPQSRKGLLPLLLLAFLGYVSVEVIVSSFAGLYLQGFNYDLRSIGVLLSLYWVGITLGRLFLGGFVAVNPLPRLLVLHGLAVLVALCFLSPSTVWLFPLIGFLVAPTFPVLYTFTQNQVGSFAIAYVFYMGTTGSNLIPAGFALIPERLIGFGMVGAVVSMTLLTALLVWRVRRSG